MAEALLAVEDLEVHLQTRRGPVHVVDKVSFRIHPGETVGIVGESGCGKSMTALSILRLVPSPPAVIAGGKVLLGGRDLLGLSETEMQGVRGKEVGMVFQDPMSTLDPAYTVGQQIIEGINAHNKVSQRQAMDRAVSLLRAVGIPMPEQRAREYPHRLSGGMRQRAVLATALACNPSLLIADEPTTALDVSIQAQILELMRALCAERRMALLFITHDLGVMAQMAQRVLVMYAGQVVEEAPVEELYEKPLHPYTEGLLRSIQTPTEREQLHVIEGTVPDPVHMPAGCRFHPRCPHVKDICHLQQPAMTETQPGHWARCWLYQP